MTQPNNEINNSKEPKSRRKSRNVRNSAPADHVENPPKMNYTKLEVGQSNIGRSKNYVEKVGLGNLRVINVDGYTDVWSLRTQCAWI